MMTQIDGEIHGVIFLSGIFVRIFQAILIRVAQFESLGLVQVCKVVFIQMY